MIHVGDALTVLRTMPDESVHCIVTSPPYWGLRDYGTGTWEGGDPGCDHRAGLAGGFKHSGLNARKDENGWLADDGKVKPTYEKSYRDVCGKCGARRIDQQLGLERTPEEYLAKMVEVFREARRVLRSDGTAWVNMGDSYAGAGYSNHDNTGGAQREDGGKQHHSTGSGLKPKDLCGIPWRLALALQADGWYLRADIIWHKPNPMPESVTDRPTKAHEMVFLLAKGQWSSRVVEFSDLSGERVHFGQNALSQLGAKREYLDDIVVQLATAILDASQIQQEFRLPPFYAEVWKQRADGSDSDFVRGLPIEHRPAVWAARLLCAEASPKEFMREVNSFAVTLADRDDLLKSWIASVVAASPSIHSDREGAVTVHHSGQICEFDFLHGKIIARKPVRCNYFYDAEAIKDDCSPSTHARISQDLAAQVGSYRANGGNKTNGPMRAVIAGSTRKISEAGSGVANNRSYEAALALKVGSRNARSVWTIPTQSFSEAHFATFPEALAERCIRAGTSERGCCPECGAPWVRVVDRSYRNPGNRTTNGPRSIENHHITAGYKQRLEVDVETLGFRATCDHGLEPEPCTVLDPFAGAGTTLLVAAKLNRRGVGIELKPEYAQMAERRIASELPLFAGANA